jgi:hypothetical protein
MSRYQITIHPDDADLWRQMTGRDETTAPPLRSRASLDYMRDSAQRNGVRITGWTETPEGYANEETA